MKYFFHNIIILYKNMSQFNYSLNFITVHKAIKVLQFQVYLKAL